MFIVRQKNFSTYYLAVQHERGPRNSVMQKQNVLRRKIIDSQSSSFQPEYICLETVIVKLRSADPFLNIIPDFDDDMFDAQLCNPDMFSEIVARLLFKCVGWIKNLSNYLGICFDDQVFKIINVRFISLLHGNRLFFCCKSVNDLVI